MKKLVLILSLIFLSFSLYGCVNQDEKKDSNIDNKEETANTDTNNSDNTDNNLDTTDEEDDDTNTEGENPAVTVKDYYPFPDNKEYIYEGQGNEYASYNVYTDYIKENRAQFRTNNGGSELVKVVEYQDGQLALLLLIGECYYRENFTNVKPTGEQDIILKEPLVKGTNWTLPDGRKRFISNDEAKVSTPSGDYTAALEVTTEGEDDVIYDYYVKDIGLVKSVFAANGDEISSSLSKIKDKVPYTQIVRFYYPDINADKIVYVEKELSFQTNDITKSVFEKKFKDFSKSKYGKVLGENVKIKSLYLNKDNKVYVDFSKEFVGEMNAGSGYEAMILQSITNTLGGYYGVPKVYITIDGEPYSSGHIVMKKGEAFEVNFDNTEEAK